MSQPTEDKITQKSTPELPAVETVKSVPTKASAKRKNGLGTKFAILKEMMIFFSTGKRWWMAPLVLLLGIIGLVLVVLQSLEYVAPFIYVAF